MSAYLDASVLVSLFAADSHNLRAIAALQKLDAPVYVNAFAALECISAFSRLVRTNELMLEQANAAIADFDMWRALQRPDVSGSEDFAADERYLRRLDLTLRGPDALHIAAAIRLQAPLMTFDVRMAQNARLLGAAIVEP